MVEVHLVDNGCELRLVLPPSYSRSILLSFKEKGICCFEWVNEDVGLSLTEKYGILKVRRLPKETQPCI